LTERASERVPFFWQRTTAGAFLVTEKEKEGASGRAAVRQFLHAIHACPTASAAWLNASEVRGEKYARMLGRTSRTTVDATRGRDGPV